MLNSQHQEIISNIIDRVKEVSGGHFRAPLKSCALVSKAWTPHSQRHLFHHVRLQYETELKRWCKNITKERAKVLSTYVKWLSYSPPYKSKDKNALERFTYFTHVETLCVFKVDFLRLKDKTELQSAFGHFGNSVRCLVLDRCIGHFPTIVNLFRFLPNLTHLDVHHCTLPYVTAVTTDDMLGTFGNVEMLRVTGSERYFLNMLMPSRFTGLKHVSFYDKGPESPGDLNLILSGCGKTIETLTVLSSQSLTITFDDRGRPEAYSLEYCKELREIAFDNMHANKPNPEIAAVLPTLLDFPHLEKVTFLAQNANIYLDEPSNKYWKRIDDVLTALGGEMQEKYNRRLQVVFDGWRAPIRDENVRERWISLLPSFAKVGEITFKHLDPPPYSYDPPTWHSLTRDVVKEE